MGIAYIIPADMKSRAETRAGIKHEGFEVRSLSLQFFPNGNTSPHDIEKGTAFKKDLARKVYISCGSGWEVAGEAITIPEAKRLIKALMELVGREKE
jgi:hypothetical protein